MSQSAPYCSADIATSRRAVLEPTHRRATARARPAAAGLAIAVLDEATAEAGSIGARLLERAADAALTGRTAVIIAHRLTQARAADRIIVLDSGRIVESGTHAELIVRGAHYATLWAACSRGAPLSPNAAPVELGQRPSTNTTV